MPSFDDDLLSAAYRLLGRRAGQRGKLPAARIRRSISTTYYALFHFVLEEASRNLIGAHNDLRRRRRDLSRVFTHAGIRPTLDKIRGTQVDAGVAELLRPRGTPTGTVVMPNFTWTTARTLSDVQALRHEADYDLNKDFTEADALAVIARVRKAITEWHTAETVADRDFKHALCLLMLLRGQLRRDG